MKQSWSAKWSRSTQVRKQRKYRHKAPLHVRRRFVSAHFAPALRKQYGKRSVPLRKGDEVEVMCGDMKKSKGKVERVALDKCRVYIEGINVKKADGSEILKPFHPSNLMITKLNLEDKRRQKVFDRAGQAKKPKAEKKDTVKKPEAKSKSAEKTKKNKPKEAKTKKPAKGIKHKVSSRAMKRAKRTIKKRTYKKRIKKNKK